jgi:hypothetical protein
MTTDAENASPARKIVRRLGFVSIDVQSDGGNSASPQTPRRAAPKHRRANSATWRGQGRHRTCCARRRDLILSALGRLLDEWSRAAPRAMTCAVHIGYIT